MKCDYYSMLSLASLATLHSVARLRLDLGDAAGFWVFGTPFDVDPWDFE